MTKLNKVTGFTLVELMVTVAIIGIIAGIAYPSYTDSVRKARRADAKSALMELAGLEERNYSVSNSYTNNLNLQASGLRWSYKDTENGIEINVSKDKYYKIEVDVDCEEDSLYSCYTLTATAREEQASDTNCATFSLDNLGRKTASPGSECW